MRSAYEGSVRGADLGYEVVIDEVVLSKIGGCIDH